MSNTIGLVILMALVVVTFYLMIVTSGNSPSEPPDES